MYIMLVLMCGLFIVYLASNITYYLQLNGYSLLDTLHTIICKLDVCIVAIYFSPAIISVLCNCLLIHSPILWVFVLVEILAFGALIFVLCSGKVERKVNVKYTPRYLRLYILSLMLSALMTGYYCYQVIFITPILFATIYLLPVFVFISILVAKMLLAPVEYIVRHFYLYKALNKLDSHGGLVRIAVTGSYGKTSTKFVLKYTYGYYQNY